MPGQGIPLTMSSLPYPVTIFFSEENEGFIAILRIIADLNEQFNPCLKTAAAAYQKAHFSFGDCKRHRGQNALRTVALDAAGPLPGPALVVFVSAYPVYALLIGRLTAVTSSRVIVQGGLRLKGCAKGFPAPKISLLKIKGKIGRLCRDGKTARLLHLGSVAGIAYERQ